MSITKIPGAKAEHAIITDQCRITRGNDGAFDEAVDRLHHQYERCLQGWGGMQGARMHLVLTLERPIDDPNDTEERQADLPPVKPPNPKKPRPVS